MSVVIETATYRMGAGGEIKVDFSAPASPTPAATCNGDAMTVAAAGGGGWTATLALDLAPGTYTVNVSVPGASKDQTVTLEISPPP